MKRYIFKISVIATLMVMGLSACSDQEYLNPSAASETQVVGDVNGLIALCNGLQFRYSIGRQSPLYNVISGAGLNTRELRVLNAGNVAEDLLAQGARNVDGGNAIVRNLWEQNHLVKSNADIILNNLSVVTDAPTRAAIQAHASIYKALALGNLAMFFEQAPIAVAEKATFVARRQLLEEAVKLAEGAASVLNGVTIPASFTRNIVSGIDYLNTANALSARYNGMLGNHDAALAASAKVSLTVSSVMRFDALTRNPIFETSYSNVNVYQPLDLTMGLPAALAPVAADKRLDFYFQSRTATGGTFRGRGFFKVESDPIPFYLPGEMMLIRAEAFANKNDLTNAVAELNRVLTKKTDVYGIGADLPAYSGPNTQADILTEIYRNRRIELFNSGLALEDCRRFNRPATERTRTFYPYPLTERDNNPNTPADPAN